MASESFYNISLEQAYHTPFQNSPFLPLLLLALSSQKHTPDTKSTFKDEYDYIIVGAGSAGSVVARRLSEMECVNVLLLEAGKQPPLLTDVPAVSESFFKTDISWKYMSMPQKYTGRLMKNRQIPWPCGKVVGGTSVINGMLYIRGRPENYNNWEAHGAKGWGWKQVSPYFIKSEDNKDPEFISNGYHGVGGPMTVEKFPYHSIFSDSLLRAHEKLGYKTNIDPNAETMIGAANYQGNLRRGQRCSTAKGYLVPVENRQNLDILSEAFVTKVVIQNRTARAVQFDYKGTSYKVKARKEIILSAGTINSAQLLLLSGLGPRRKLQKLGIPVLADLPVGKNFHNHGGSFAVMATNLSSISFEETLQKRENILEYINNRTGILTTNGLVGLSYLKDNPHKPPLTLPDYELLFVAGPPKSAKDRFNIPEEVYRNIFSSYENRTMLWCIAEIFRPRSKGYISIKSRDPYEAPLIQPNYLKNPADVRDEVSGLKTCYRILQSPEMAKFGVKPLDTVIPGCKKKDGNEDKYLECFARSFFYSGSHQVGTAKMGDPSDPNCVTDPQLRVRGIKGLRVVDASVMPIIITGNTNNPIIMLAEKASEMIKNDMRCDCHYHV